MSFVTLIEGGTVTLGAIKAGVGLIRSFFPDKKKDLEDVTFMVYEDEQPHGKVRIILINEANGWEKAIRIYHGGSGYDEVKCGDKSGSVAHDNSHLKYSMKTIDFPWSTGGQYIALQLWKPKAFGIWYDLQEIRITPSNQKDYEGKTLVFYWGTDGSTYFKDPTHLLKPYQL
ncbi:hypothetical protein RB653_007783 [Dictyostelium firmibasis]|uniref:Uncharacterized protein n=1 Tax=Dictyostelium firmibasis TaxID=79012 RepID=A0AAN7TP77_9MYCE